MADGLPLRCLVTERQSRRIPWDTADPRAPELIVGNLLDEETVFQAVSGVHTIIHLESAFWWGRQRDLERVELAGSRNLIAQARAARVGRLIVLSHLGAAPSSAYTLHNVKGRLEDLVRASGLAYTIIRSGLVFGEDDAFINHIVMMMSVTPLVFFMPGQGEVVLHPIYIDDLVAAVRGSLESINAVDNTLELGGPEYTTLRDLLATVMRVSGKYRIIVPLPPYLMRLITQIYSRILPRSLMTSQWLDILATNRTAKLGAVYDYFGFRPRRFEDTLLTYLPRRRYLLRTLRYILRRRPRSI